MSAAPILNRQDSEESNKLRRSRRACLQCRSRKQRCMQASTPDNDDRTTTCKRCRSLQLTCSFEIEDLQSHPNVSPTDATQLMVDLQRRLRSQEATIALHEARIARLESTQGAITSPSPAPGLAIATTDPQTSHDRYGDACLNISARGEQSSPAEGLRIDNMDLGPPTATLQSLRGMEGAATTSTLPSDHVLGNSVVCTVFHRHARYDPVIQKILTYREASDAVRLYTERYHPMAPFLSTEISADKLVGQRSRLLLAICTIALRVRPTQTVTTCSDHQRQWQMHKLTELYENMLTDAVLWPESADIDLDAVCVLLLHVQWMPLERLDPAPGAQRAKRSNYSDLSAWCDSLLLPWYERHADVIAQVSSWHSCSLFYFAWS